MVGRRIRLILEAQVDSYIQNTRRASRETEQLGSKLRTAVNSQEMQQLGRHMTAFGAAIVGGLGVATKAAMDWESEWTGVMRRIDGTPQELDALESGLRGLATTMAASHSEIAEVAASAAQLGVATTDIESFTEVMVQMGATTDMTADQAATSMQRFSNVMGTPTSEVENLASAVVDLGNNGATTESEIAQMGQRLAGAGRQAGMSEGDVLGLAAAMSSVGINAQMGGTNMSMTMQEISRMVENGSAELETLADVAGMSASEFESAWREDAAGALVEFVTGLGAVQESGGNTIGILDELGFTGQRQVAMLLQLSSASDLMTESMDRGNEAFSEGTAMSEEYGRIAETAAYRIQVAWSQMQDAMIDVGGVILPALAPLTEGLADLVSGFSDLPGPAQTSLTLLTGFAGAASLAGGSFLMLAPGIFRTVGALDGFTRSGRGVSGRLGRIGGAAAMAAGPLGVLFLVDSLARLWDTQHDTAEAAQRIEAEMRRMGDSAADAATGLEGAAMASTDWWRGHDSTSQLMTDMDGIGSAMQNMDLLAGDLTSRMSEFWGINASAVDRNNLEAYFESVEISLSSLARSGDFDVLQAQVQAMANDAEAYGYSAEDLGEHLSGVTSELLILREDSSLTQDEVNQLNEILYNLGEGSGRASQMIDPLTGELIETGEAAEDAALGADEFEESLEGMGDEARSTADAIRELTDALFESGMLTMDAREAASRYQAELAGIGEAVALINEEQGGLGAALNETATDFNLSEEAGRTANEAFQGLARSGMAEVQAMASDGAGLPELSGRLEDIHGDLIQTANDFGITGDAAQELAAEVLGIPDGVDIETWLHDEAARQGLEALVNGVYETEIMVDGNTQAAESVMDAFLAGDYEAMAEILGNDVRAREVMDAFLAGDYETVADLLANDSQARSTVGDFTSTDWQTFIDAIAETAAAEAALNEAARDRWSTVTQTIRRSFTTSSGGSGGAALAESFSTGGGVYGIGGPTQDNVPANLSVGEHVLTARDVQALGGQQAVYDFRQTLHQPPSSRGMVASYASGGGVGRSRDFDRIAEAVSMGGGRGVRVHIGQVNNPRGVPTEQSVKDGLEYASALGGSFDD
ncbi:phage tail tape measure protein [Nesterenkonia populi]|uniref:phage tail tape measure protein n=1 Tax=Nesterenkonia populi TaxID=1591087 RepID=UPI0011BF252A|nr:phage tail tape measure protein [Nesterenkonia populi]